MDVALDDSELAQEADRLVQSFQADAAREAGVQPSDIVLATVED